MLLSSIGRLAPSRIRSTTKPFALPGSPPSSREDGLRALMACRRLRVVAQAGRMANDAGFDRAPKGVKGRCRWHAMATLRVSKECGARAATRSMLLGFKPQRPNLMPSRMIEELPGFSRTLRRGQCASGSRAAAANGNAMTSVVIIVIRMSFFRARTAYVNTST